MSDFADGGNTRQRKAGRKQLNAIAEEVIHALQGKVIIHRYDAYSTNSIYLKFDYGVANSLRISDHAGKQHLKYRFNILAEMPEGDCGLNSDGMMFYSPDRVKDCCRAILEAKEAKKRQYRSYEAVLRVAKENVKDQGGFWSGARYIAN